MNNKGINKKILIAGLGVGATIAAVTKLAVTTVKNKKKCSGCSDAEHSTCGCKECKSDCDEVELNNEKCESCTFNPFSDDYIGDDDDYDFGNLNLDLSGSTFNFCSHPAFGGFYPSFSESANAVFGNGKFGNHMLFGVSHKGKREFPVGTEIKIHCGLCEIFDAGEMTSGKEPNGFKVVVDENGALNCKGVCEVLKDKMSNQDNDIECTIKSTPGVKCVGRCGACTGVRTTRRTKKSEEE